jgi:hypothetical protein
MRYRGVLYEIRSLPEKNRWAWEIHPPGGKSIGGNVAGQRQRAVVAAKDAIDRWWKRSPPEKAPDRTRHSAAPARLAGVPI